MVLTANHRRSGFSLIELVIVVVILGVIAAIAIPRMSRGSAGASDSALSSNLAVLRSAIDTYAAEHNGDFPTVAAFKNQLTLYSDKDGATSATPSGVYLYGPYLRDIPPLPVGAKKGNTGVAAADGDGVGWIYDVTTGNITANTAATEKDAREVPYSSY